MSCTKGKKIRSGQYHNGVNFMRQPHKVFTPGTKVIEKSSGQIYTVLEKPLKNPRSLIRIERDSDLVVKYVRTTHIHTIDYAEKLLKRKSEKVLPEKKKKKKVSFVKNTSLQEFKNKKRDFNEMLKAYNPVKNTGGGVSIDYSSDPKGKFYIHRMGNNETIDKYNKTNLEVMNYLYNTLNDPKRMTVREHIIPRSRILDIFMKDSSGSSLNLVPDCNNKSDFYNIVNETMID
jgi:hypothetical protein